MTSSSTGFHVSSPGFAIVPYALMDQFSDHRYLTVYLWLYRHGHGSVDGCWASVATISGESGVGINNVRKILKVLAKHGWVDVVERPGYTTLYYVHTETSRHPSRKREPHPSQNREGTPHGIVRRTISPEQNPIEPPVSPKPPQPAKPAKQSSKSDNNALAVVDEQTFAEFGEEASKVLLDWWQNHKTGSKTNLALKFQFTELRKIRSMGGDSLVLAQAEFAVRSGVMRGKGWMQIDASQCRDYGIRVNRTGSKQTHLPLLPSQELLDIAELAKSHPLFFSDATISDGAVVVHYTATIRQTLSYPETSRISMKSSLIAEIEHFRARTSVYMTPF